MQPAEVLVHVVGALIVAAMLARSLRKMRALSLAAGLAAVAWCVLTGQGAAVLLWALAFTIVCAGQFFLLTQRTRVGRMRAEERALLEDILRVENPAEQRRLIGLIAWRDAGVGEVLIRQGQPSPPLIYVASGSAAIELDGRAVGQCGAGDFLGDMSSATGEPASTAVIVTEPMRIAVVDRTALAAMAVAAPEIGAAFDGAINRALATKIQRMNAMAAAH